MGSRTDPSPHVDIRDLLASMQADIQALRDEIATLTERTRKGDPAAYWTRKIRRRELRELDRQLRELLKREHRRATRAA